MLLRANYITDGSKIETDAWHYVIKRYNDNTTYTAYQEYFFLSYCYTPVLLYSYTPILLYYYTPILLLLRSCLL